MELIFLLVEVNIMETALTSVQEASMGFKARKLRVSRLLTQQELADIAGVSLEEVNSFERNLPVPLDARRKVHKALWARKDRGTQ